MRNSLKRMLCLLLVLVLAASMAACTSGGSDETTAATTAATTAPTGAPTLPDVTVDNPVTYFSLSMGESYDAARSLAAYPDESGQLYVEYVGEVKKVGAVDMKLMHNITQKLEESGLAELNGAESYESGEAFASMYITYADTTYIAANYGGVVAEEFMSGYGVMEDFFRELTASMEVYVPQPLVTGQVDETQLNALMEIMEGSGLEPLDSFMISEVVKDEFFAYTLGLTGDEGITAGTTCSAMMMTTPYGITVVTVEDAASIAAVRADFENNLNWQKWVCVIPTNALIAQKDNMVLCLMGSDDLFAKTEAAITAAGWTEITTFENPNA